MAAITLHGRVVGGVAQVDGDLLGIDDVVGSVQRLDGLMPRPHRVLPNVCARGVQALDGDQLEGPLTAGMVAATAVGAAKIWLELVWLK